MTLSWGKLEKRGFERKYVFPVRVRGKNDENRSDQNFVCIFLFFSDLPKKYLFQLEKQLELFSIQQDKVFLPSLDW